MRAGKLEGDGCPMASQPTGVLAVKQQGRAGCNEERGQGREELVLKCDMVPCGEPVFIKTV